VEVDVIYICSAVNVRVVVIARYTDIQFIGLTVICVSGQSVYLWSCVVEAVADCMRLRHIQVCLFSVTDFSTVYQHRCQLILSIYWLRCGSGGVE